MTFDQFRLRILRDLNWWMETEVASRAMEYDEWLVRFALFAAPWWVVSGYGEREDIR